ncbi:Alpha/beta hydrolase family-domain-containing protein [Lipomyces japonicus]|uniref:Alpha/beta hydrolase family-domain-containing protein n=1 Tax=Lipomyces japonicus TaxID=56871 RepID=UPI0034CFDA03
MSSLRKDVLKSKLSAVPAVSLKDLIEEEEEEESGSVQLNGLLTGLRRPRNKVDYSPIGSGEYFPVRLVAPLSGDDSEHVVYYKPPLPARLQNDDQANTSQRVNKFFIFHHGAGSSGLTFAVTCKELQARLGSKGNESIGLVSFDARGHGSTQHTADDEDLALSTLARDFVQLVLFVVEHLNHNEDDKVEVDTCEFVFVGHSLGGAVVTEAVNQFDTLWKSQLRPKPRISGLVVLDIVEGSALEGLASMRGFLASRPQYFGSVADGVRWHVKSHTIRSVESARVSVPDLLMEPSSSNNSNGQDHNRVRWRTDLAATEQFWTGWFLDLSAKFLAARTGKMLVLAGTDRLDRTLTIGQMQGKYQLEVVPESGHFIQEDAASKLAELMAQFWFRNRAGAAQHVTGSWR